MSDSPATPTAAHIEAPAPFSNAAEQVRLRKERREAKIRAGSMARLNKITGLNKAQQDQYSIPGNASEPPHPDSESVDISNQNNQPENTQSHSKNNTYMPTSVLPAPTEMNGEALHEMMRQLSRDNARLSSSSINDNPFASTNYGGIPPVSDSSAGIPPMSEDPMMKIMQQLIGENFSCGGIGDIPVKPSLTDSQEESTTASPQANIWRVIHALWAISFGIYISMITQFTGSKIERERSSLGFKNIDSQVLKFASSPTSFFYLFITIEVVLLSSQYFLDKENNKPKGILGMLIGALQEPIRGYAKLGLRYIDVWITVSRDAMVCVFILGVFAWWRNELNA